MNLMPPEPQFAGTSAALSIVLTNDAGVGAVRHRPGGAGRDARGPLGLDRRAGAGQQPRSRWRSSRRARGLHRVPPLTAETRFPLGTFRVWTVWRPAAQVLVYPAPEAGSAAAAAGRAARRRRGNGPRAERRRVRRRARLPPRRPAEAGGLEEGRQGRRTGEPRHTSRPSATSCGWTSPRPAPAGHRAPAVAADRVGAAGRPAGPGLRPAPARPEIAPATGAAHERQCLEALATC